MPSILSPDVRVSAQARGRDLSAVLDDLPHGSSPLHDLIREVAAEAEQAASMSDAELEAFGERVSIMYRTASATLSSRVGPRQIFRWDPRTGTLTVFEPTTDDQSLEACLNECQTDYDKCKQRSATWLCDLSGLKCVARCGSKGLPL